MNRFMTRPANVNRPARLHYLADPGDGRAPAETGCGRRGYRGDKPGTMETADATLSVTSNPAAVTCVACLKSGTVKA